LAHTKKSNSQLFFNGLLSENPIFRLALSMCRCGISTSVMNGILLGVQFFCSGLFELHDFGIKNYIHPRIRIPPTP